jgi:hypothetical protein
MMGMVRIRATVVAVIASAVLCANVPLALADGAPPPPPPPPSTGGGSSGGSGGGSSSGGGGSSTYTPPATTTTTTTTPSQTTMAPNKQHQTVVEPAPPPRATLKAEHHGQPPSYVDPAALTAVKPLGSQGPEATITSSSSRRPYLLLGAGVVLLGLALALLLAPAGIRLRRRGMPSASTR